MSELTEMEKHRAIRERLAIGSVNQLFRFLKEHDRSAEQAYRYNVILLSKNKNSRVIKKNPCITEYSYSSNKRKIGFLYGYHSDANRSRFPGDEMFEDEGLVVLDEEGFKMFITKHALQRGYERAWWFLKDKPVKEQLEAFMSCIYPALNAIISAKGKLKKDSTLVVEGEILNMVAQLNSSDLKNIAILTFLISTAQKGQTDETANA